MSKGESGGGGGFLSKVARFVRHPTVNWSELDSRLPGTGSDEDRQALKAAIERKRRNDQVRRKEFDQLRLILKDKQAARQAESEVDLDGLAVTPTSQDEDKARTIEKIARIEAQMAQHWLDRQGQEAKPALHIASAATIPGRLEGGVTMPAHLQARAARDVASTLPIDMLVGDSRRPLEQPTLPMVDTTPPEAVFLHQAIEEASVRFANGDPSEAERLLQNLIAQEVNTPVGRGAWLSLLDLYHALGRLESFEEAAAEFAERFGCDVPRWPAPPALALEAAPVSEPRDSCVWVCPLLLDEGSVKDLGRMVARATGAFWLDWTALVSADVKAAEALLTLVQQWLEQPLEFRFLGSGVLRRRLKASTPSGRRENEAVWWLLRLALLRLMHRADEFDLASLDFCVTYGVLPPTWQPPVCAFEMADALPSSVGAPPAPLEIDAPLVDEPIRPLVTQLGGLDVLEWPAMNTQVGTGITLPPDTQMPILPHTLPSQLPTLSGVLKGDITPLVGRLQQALAQHSPGQPFQIDCQRLAQVDFVAAGGLLQWMLATLAQGVAVELRGVNRLVAAFFHVVGIDEAVTVRLREY